MPRKEKKMGTKRLHATKGGLQKKESTAIGGILEKKRRAV